MRPLLAITMGDVNGVGPEILVKALAKPDIWEACRTLVIGCAKIFEQARSFAPACPPPVIVFDPKEALSAAGRTPVLDGGIPAPPLRAGELDPEAGRCAVEWVKLAVQLALARHVDAIVTCPINKEGIHRAGYRYSGHTELLAEMTSSRDYRMALFAGDMRVVHITSHLSLRDAIAAVKAERIVTSIRLGHEALSRLGLPRGRIAVAGLNPHAGEAGAFGSEEIEEIIPAIRQCRAEGIDCSGPYPADTVFRRMRAGEFDLVVAMYHDQGHAPTKLVAMDEGVNVTLGIPIIRTSVDHGTAYDIAGKGIAREHSLCAAIRLAARFAAQSQAEKAERRSDAAQHRETTL